MRAKFSVECSEIGFSRTHEMPLDARGYCHALADDLSRAFELYQLRVQNQKLRQALLRCNEISNTFTNREDAELIYRVTTEVLNDSPF